MPIALGVISGTSMDGIDLAAIDIEPHEGRDEIELLAYDEQAYCHETQSDLLDLVDADTVSLADVSRLNFVVGHEFAEAVVTFMDTSDIPMTDVDVIGTYGQTVGHYPDGEPPSTLQLIEEPVVAEKTGIDTVASFFVRDLVTGGAGAPSLPLYDFIRYGDQTEHRLVLNIGGIANVAYLPAEAGLDRVQAFDVGPGNMLIDAAIRSVTRGDESYDQDGSRARQGTTDEDLLEDLMSHAFIHREPPKSTGRTDFGAGYFDRVRTMANEHGVEDDDFVATLTAFTAAAIAANVREFVDQPVDSVIAFGGGAQNPMILQELRARLEADVMVSEAIGFRHDAREVQGIAYLAYRSKRGLQTNVPAATGGRPVTGGSMARGAMVE